MDQLDAMRVFVAAVEAGSLAGAARSLGRSPAAVTRALAALEAHVGAPLLQRTTRAMRLTEAGERYAPVCRRVLTELEEAALSAVGDRAAPRGVLTLTAPVMFGARILRPVVGAFLAGQPAVQARLLLLDRVVNLIDEGIDAALRIAHLPDSTLTALRVGEVRRVVCAAPSYLASRPPIAAPADLAAHDCIATGPGDVWAFPAHSVRIRWRLSVNQVQAARDAAVAGEGVVRLLSYQIDEDVADGRLVVLLRHAEPPPLPVHLVAPEGRLGLAKVRAFADFAVPRLKARLAGQATPSSAR